LIYCTFTLLLLCLYCTWTLLVLHLSSTSAIMYLDCTCTCNLHVLYLYCTYTVIVVLHMFCTFTAFIRTVLEWDCSGTLLTCTVLYCTGLVPYLRICTHEHVVQVRRFTDRWYSNSSLCCSCTVSYN